MRYEEIIDRVRQRGAMASEAEAEAALNATVTALGEQLDDGTAMSFAPQLPEALRTYLRLESSEGPEPERGFDADAFVERVGGLAGLEPDAARGSVVAVVSVLGEATGGAFDELRSDLPPDAQAIFAGVPGPSGPR